MNIYIYGNSKFNKEIHELLAHANAKFRLGDKGTIIELTTLKSLKNAIAKNPEDIYLIDDSKIIKKNSLNSKFKFLTPKNGIEQEYLLDHGIGDMSVDSLDELAKHIIHKLDALTEDDNIEDSIRDIVDEAYEEDGFEELDSELSTLLTHEEKKEKIKTVEKNEVEKEELPPLDDDDMEDFFSQMPKMEDDILATSSKDYFEEYINEESAPTKYEEKTEQVDTLPNTKSSTYEIINKRLLKELESAGAKEEDFFDLDTLISTQSVKKKENLPIDKPPSIEQSIKPIEKSDIIKEVKEDILHINEGEKMSDNFTELDSLNESDILSALEGLNDKTVTPTPVKAETVVPQSSSSNGSITLEANNLDEISQLIKQLLNNKTLEISIRIKD